jgi:putative oxidoreductase
MDSLQRYVLVLSRVLVAIIFLLNGLGIISQAQAAKERIEYGAPASLVPFFMLCGRTLEVVAGFCLAFGIYPRVAALALVVFLVPTTFVAHSFWRAAGTAARTPQVLNFLKNTSMVGACCLSQLRNPNPRSFCALRGQTLGNERRTNMSSDRRSAGIHFDASPAP